MFNYKRRPCVQIENQNVNISNVWYLELQYRGKSRMREQIRVCPERGGLQIRFELVNEFSETRIMMQQLAKISLETISINEGSGKTKAVIVDWKKRLKDRDPVCNRHVISEDIQQVVNRIDSEPRNAGDQLSELS
jgi:hypothetical protein